MCRKPSGAVCRLPAIIALTLLCAPGLSALPLDDVKPGVATNESMRAAFGPPVARSTSAAYPMEIYEAPQEGLARVTAWYDEAFRLRWARIILVNALPPETVQLLFLVEGEPVEIEGNPFDTAEATGGLTETFPHAGLYMWVADGVVKEAWRTAPGADLEEIRAALAEYAANAQIMDVPGGEGGDGGQGGKDEDETPPEDLEADEPDDAFDEPVDDEVIVPEDEPADHAGGDDESTEADADEEARGGRARLGVAVKALESREAERLNVRAGAYVAAVAPGSAADRAGLAVGDVITAFAGRGVAVPADLARLFAESDPNRHYRVDIVRAGRRTFVTVGPGEEVEKAGDDEPREKGRLGAGVRSVNYQEARRVRLPGVEGALVVSVAPGGPAEAGGLRRNDFIISWDGRKVANADDLARMAAGTPPGREVAVTVVRSGKRLELNVTMGSAE